ncbi:sulfurtransferase FdhD [Methylogaea oryzae]|uniref:Sulfur carrier protein FdhD n=3 Tax=Methylogaea oryzae TaxID=1295382 RepID=A0A8D4VNJ1_9GAMM|nr:sulfurtransferase FdhD [Methylogaea oryzae]
MGEAGNYSESAVQRFRNGLLTQTRDYVAEEVPVALIYNGVPYTVMLATPDDLEDFAVGFSLSEGIVADAGQISLREIRRQEKGVEVWLKIPGDNFRALSQRGRSMAGRTGCGLCGTNSLDEAVRTPSPVGDGVRVATESVARALESLKEGQTLNGVTGAVHGAAWANLDGEIQFIREDVGRHNALDKLIGALVKHAVDLKNGFVVVTSRASYEMVQKTATAGIALLAAVSAPTGLAIRLAEACGLTLVGFARGRDHNVYSHPQRLFYH